MDNEKKPVLKIMFVTGNSAFEFTLDYPDSYEDAEKDLAAIRVAKSDGCWNTTITLQPDAGPTIVDVDMVACAWVTYE